jgi:hypothetical protein
MWWLVAVMATSFQLLSLPGATGGGAVGGAVGGALPPPNIDHSKYSTKIKQYCTYSVQGQA